MENEIEYEEIEVQLDDSKVIRLFKNVSNLIVKNRDIEFDFVDFDVNTYEHFQSHATISGKIVLKINKIE